MLKNFRVATFISLLCFQVTAPAEPPILPQTLTLKESLEIAATNNFQVRALEKEFNARRSIAQSDLGKLFPTVAAISDFSQVDRARIPNFNGNRFGADKTWNADIRVDQPIFTGGRVWNNYQRSRFLARAAEQSLLEAAAEARSATKERYYEIILNKARIDVAEELAKFREELLRAEKRRLEVGTVSEFNVIRAEVALANSRPPIIRANNDYRISIVELGRVLGVIIPESVKINDPEALAITPLNEELSVFLERAKGRPDLERLKLVVEAEEAGIRVARSDLYPQLGAFGSFGMRSSPFSSNYDDRLKGWQAGLTANWRIFDTFSTINNIEAAESSRDRSLVALDELGAAIDLEVRRAYSRYAQGKELVEASKSVVREARESVRLAEARSEVGAGIQLDILEAQVALVEARTNEVQSLFEYQTALAQLERAIGALL
jgi:outer membrane protein TolC